MDQLLAMRTFVRVAERGSFSAVAREMETTQSQVSRQVANLEARLGAALLTRTTRQVQLTAEGQVYLEFARRALTECDEGEALLRGGRQTLAGRLRISTGAGLFRHVVFEPLQAMLAQHPGLELDVQINDAWVDLVTEGIDLAIRGGELSDSGLIARKLADLERVVCAAPAYLQREAAHRPPIVHPAALELHECILFTNWRDPRWHFEDEHAQRYSVNVAGRWRFN
jgi:DNA-binding transcriptional LysR family regulator